MQKLNIANVILLSDKTASCHWVRQDLVRQMGTHDVSVRRRVRDQKVVFSVARLSRVCRRLLIYALLGSLEISMSNGLLLFVFFF